MPFKILLYLFLGLSSLFAHNILSNDKLVEQAKVDLAIQEKLGKIISESLQFRDETNQIVDLKKYFSKGKPVIITPVYYLCPHLCGLTLSGVVDAINAESRLKLGKDYEIITITMNPEETPEIAKKKKEEQIQLLQFKSEIDKLNAINGWHFLTGEAKNINQLFQEIGFRFKKEGDEYAHTSSITFVTPNFKVARYLYGVNFKGNDFRLALIEASQGKISSFVDQVMFFCFSYNHSKRVYDLVAWKVMSFAVGGIVLMVMILISILWLQDRKRK